MGMKSFEQVQIEKLMEAVVELQMEVARLKCADAQLTPAELSYPAPEPIQQKDLGEDLYGPVEIEPQPKLSPFGLWKERGAKAGRPAKEGLDLSASEAESLDNEIWEEAINGEGDE